MPASKYLIVKYKRNNLISQYFKIFKEQFGHIEEKALALQSL